MLDYRLYLLGAAGHVEGVRDIKAVDDAAAIIAATTGQSADRMELWCGARFVKEWGLAMPGQRLPPKYGATIERVRDYRPVPPIREA